MYLGTINRLYYIDTPHMLAHTGTIVLNSASNFSKLGQGILIKGKRKPDRGSLAYLFIMSNLTQLLLIASMCPIGLLQPDSKETHCRFQHMHLEISSNIVEN